MVALTRSRKRTASEELFQKVIQCLAEEGWLPWWEDEHQHLRLVSTMTKITVDHISGPDFESIVEMLNLRNGFNRESGACDYCAHNIFFFRDETKCQTCIATKVGGELFFVCNCKESHRFAPILWENDPRLDKNFTELPPREQVKQLLQFCRFCVSNFLQRFVVEHDDGEDEDKDDDRDSSTYNLTLVEPTFLAHDFGDFGEQLRTYNRPIFNLLHNLLMIGMNVNDLGFFEAQNTIASFSPWRETFLYGQDVEREDYDYEHDGSLHFDYHEHMVHEFLQVHQPPEDEEIVITYGDEEGQGLTASQIRYVPKVLHQCIVNSIDSRALELLGPRISASIDLYRPAWTTLCENDISLQWMPCLGGLDDSNYEPLNSFEGYNPRMQHISFAFGLDMFDHEQKATD